MKCISLFTLMFIQLQINAQFTIDAGQDLYLCTTPDSFELAPINLARGNMIIGGQPTANGGTKPYKYNWYCSIKTISKTIPFIYASDILDDTSNANPKFKSKIGLNATFTDNRKIIIYLEVTDSNGSKLIDSILLMQSSFTYLMMNKIGKLKDDTIILPNLAGGGIPSPVDIWSPTKYLIDTNKAGTRTYTKDNITYYHYRIDSLQCKSSTSSLLIETYLSRLNTDLTSRFIINFHNPINETSVFKINKNKTPSILKVEVLNFTGNVLYSTSEIDVLNIGRITKDIGIYYITFYSTNGDIETFKILKE